MHKWSAVGAPHHNQTQESEEEGKISISRDHFSPELPGGNVLIVDFSGKLDYLLLHHYLVSLLHFLIGLFPALLHVARVGGVVLLHNSSSATLSSFPGNNGSVLHGPQVYTAQCLNACATAQDCTAPSKTQPSHGLFSCQEAEPRTNMRLT